VRDDSQRRTSGILDVQALPHELFQQDFPLAICDGDLAPLVDLRRDGAIPNRGIVLGFLYAD
jgi:hypothetical protein